MSSKNNSDRDLSPDSEDERNYSARTEGVTDPRTHRERSDKEATSGASSGSEKESRRRNKKRENSGEGWSDSRSHQPTPGPSGEKTRGAEPNPRRSSRLSARARSESRDRNRSLDSQGKGRSRNTTSPFESLSKLARRVSGYRSGSASSKSGESEDETRESGKKASRSRLQPKPSSSSKSSLKTKKDTPEPPSKKPAVIEMIAELTPDEGESSGKAPSSHKANAKPSAPPQEYDFQSSSAKRDWQVLKEREIREAVEIAREESRLQEAESRRKEVKLLLAAAKAEDKKDRQARRKRNKNSSQSSAHETSLSEGDSDSSQNSNTPFKGPKIKPLWSDKGDRSNFDIDYLIDHKKQGIVREKKKSKSQEIVRSAMKPQPQGFPYVTPYPSQQPKASARAEEETHPFREWCSCLSCKSFSVRRQRKYEQDESQALRLLAREQERKRKETQIFSTRNRLQDSSLEDNDFLDQENFMPGRRNESGELHAEDMDTWTRNQLILQWALREMTELQELPEGPDKAHRQQLLTQRCRAAQIGEPKPVVDCIAEDRQSDFMHIKEMMRPEITNMINTHHVPKFGELPQLPELSNVKVVSFSQLKKDIVGLIPTTRMTIKNVATIFPVLLTKLRAVMQTMAIHQDNVKALIEMQLEDGDSIQGTWALFRKWPLNEAIRQFAAVYIQPKTKQDQRADLQDMKWDPRVPISQNIMAVYHLVSELNPQSSQDAIMREVIAKITHQLSPKDYRKVREVDVRAITPSANGNALSIGEYVGALSRAEVGARAANAIVARVHMVAATDHEDQVGSHYAPTSLSEVSVESEKGETRSAPESAGVPKDHFFDFTSRLEKRVKDTLDGAAEKAQLAQNKALSANNRLLAEVKRISQIHMVNGASGQVASSPDAGVRAPEQNRSAGVSENNTASRDNDNYQASSNTNIPMSNKEWQSNRDKERITNRDQGGRGQEQNFSSRNSQYDRSQNPNYRGNNSNSFSNKDNGYRSSFQNRENNPSYDRSNNQNYRNSSNSYQNRDGNSRPPFQNRDFGNSRGPPQQRRSEAPWNNSQNRGDFRPNQFQNDRNQRFDDGNRNSRNGGGQNNPRRDDNDRRGNEQENQAPKYSVIRPFQTNDIKVAQDKLTLEWKGDVTAAFKDGLRKQNLGELSQGNPQGKNPSRPRWQGDRVVPASPPYNQGIFYAQRGGIDAQLNRAVLSWSRYVCHQCGDPDCAWNNPHCPYYQQEQTFGMCQLCRRGFHIETACKAIESEQVGKITTGQQAPN